MNCFRSILEFIGGVVLVFVVGILIGHLFGLDKKDPILQNNRMDSKK